MVQKPVSNTLRRLARRLFESVDDQDRFIDALINPHDRPSAVVWMTDRPSPSPFVALPAATWQPSYVDLISFDQRPGRHAVHESGSIYCLDPASVFTSQVFTQIQSVSRVIDLCASPGGKSILAWRRFHPQQLICNEVTGKRLGALVSNLRRCRLDAVDVVSKDSARLADIHSEWADLVIVDAPCSGQSLVARGKKSPGCFHPATINMNANRQRRILSNAVRMVVPGGYLAYITCTYSLKENERNVDWLMKKNPGLSPVRVPLLDDHCSPYSDIPCYRMWPWNAVGSGGFAVLLHRIDSTIGTD